MGKPDRHADRWREMSAKRLSPEAKERAARLKAVGATVAAISRDVGASRQTVRRALARPEAEAIATDCRAELRKHRARFVELWIAAAEVAARQGKHLPAMHALLSLREVDQPNPPPVLVSQPMQVAIGIQLPGLPPPSGPSFTVAGLPSSTHRHPPSSE